MEKLKWLTSTVFLELLGLSQCLPGPTSTQVSFAIGVVQKGIAGGFMTGDLGYLVSELFPRIASIGSFLAFSFSKEGSMYATNMAVHLARNCISNGGFLCAGVLFQYPGFLISALVGAGAANFLKHPAPCLQGIVAGALPANKQAHCTSQHGLRRPVWWHEVCDN